MLAIINFVAETYGWTLDYIYDQMSLTSSLLLMRQKLASDGHPGISLEDKEMIDNYDWKTLVKQNRENMK